jgi:serine protease
MTRIMTGQATTEWRVPRIAQLVLAVVLLGGSAAIGSAALDPAVGSALQIQVPRPSYDSATITVKFRDGTRRDRLYDVVAEMGCSIDKPSRFTPGLCIVRIPARATVQQMVAAFGKRLDIEYAEPTGLNYITWVPDDPRYDRQWNFEMIGVPQAWDKVGGGDGFTTVAVLDTGVAYENYEDFIVAPDLAGQAFRHPQDFVNDDGHANDDNHHGTHVCGTIAQATNNATGVAGIAYNIVIMPVKVLNANGVGTDLDISDGIRWAVDHGARILNCSLGGPPTIAKYEAVKYAYNKGKLLIAAAGNNNTGRLKYPARYEKAMGVGAVDRDRNRAYYSNWGTGIDVVAPGGETDVASQNGILQNAFPLNDPDNMGYYYFMGTSMATPHVSALAALLWSEGTYSGRQEVKDRIEATCEDLGAAGYDTTFGHGLINANAALPDVPPTLSWLGTGGYTTDGVDPESGDPDSKSEPGTRFIFRVKYLDPDGDLPTTAELRLEQLMCDGTWACKSARTMATKQTGSIKTGATYQTTCKLGNAVYRYWFNFADNDGAATGRPTKAVQGPYIKDHPILCWSNATGYDGEDGVNPNSGPLGTSFRFQVVYRDSHGDAPTTAELEIMRSGSAYRTVPLVKSKGERYRVGQRYYANTKLVEGGFYKYRFSMADSYGSASGSPSRWTVGPTITRSTSQLAVTGLSATPTAAGAQVTLALSADAAVTVTALNVAGRPVRVIARGKELSAGANTLLWDRRNAAGLAVPPGRYIIRIEAKGPTGESSNALTSMVLP